MEYKDALKAWGKIKLDDANNGAWRNPALSAILESVKVEFEFDEGNNCCGGSDPDCYCSLAESPSANVRISGIDENSGMVMYTSISHWDFDFARILAEIVDAADGVITKE